MEGGNLNNIRERQIGDKLKNKLNETLGVGTAFLALTPKRQRA